MIALWATVVAALIAAVLAPWAKARIDKATTADGELVSAKATLAATTENRINELFEEHRQMRSAYRSDVDDLRSQLRESSARVALLESEVAEWRAGIRGVPGVWVAIPASVWNYVRTMLPDLPPTRFPGEGDELAAGEHG